MKKRYVYLIVFVGADSLKETLYFQSTGRIFDHFFTSESEQKLICMELERCNFYAFKDNRRIIRKPLL